MTLGLALSVQAISDIARSANYAASVRPELGSNFAQEMLQQVSEYTNTSDTASTQVASTEEIAAPTNIPQVQSTDRGRV